MQFLLSHIDIKEIRYSEVIPARLVIRELGAEQKMPSSILERGMGVFSGLDSIVSSHGLYRQCLQKITIASAIFLEIMDNE